MLSMNATRSSKRSKDQGSSPCRLFDATRLHDKVFTFSFTGKPYTLQVASSWTTDQILESFCRSNQLKPTSDFAQSVKSLVELDLKPYVESEMKRGLGVDKENCGCTSSPKRSSKLSKLQHLTSSHLWLPPSPVSPPLEAVPRVVSGGGGIKIEALSQVGTEDSGMEVEKSEYGYETSKGDEMDIED